MHAKIYIIVGCSKFRVCFPQHSFHHPPTLKIIRMMGDPALLGVEGKGHPGRYLAEEWV